MSLAADAIVPIPRAGVTELVVQRLLGFVTGGQLRPGDRLPSERELSDRLQVSRPTIREAMRALSALGVVEVRHGGGAFVTALEADDLLGPLTFFLSLSETTVDKLYEARAVIEGEIAALAAGRATDADLAALAGLIGRQAAATDDARTYREVDSAFHERLARMADNPFLARASRSLNVLGLEFRKVASETAATIRLSIQDHEAVLAALAARDADGARRAMAAHMRQVLATTKAALRAAGVPRTQAGAEEP